MTNQVSRMRVRLRSAAKRLLPRAAVSILQRIRASRRVRAFRGSTVEETFDRIYREGHWDRGDGGVSGSGSYGTWCERYVELVSSFIGEQEIRSITDIGCGDFHVGGKLCGLVGDYVALDVSREIIERNKRRFSTLANVRFVQSNACEESIPSADLVTVRQVLQHLTNAQIEQVLSNIEGSGARFAIIAEHGVVGPRATTPNHDMPNQSADIRAMFGSAVDPTAPPFSRPMVRLATIPADDPTQAAELAVYLWRLRS